MHHIAEFPSIRQLVIAAESLTVAKDLQYLLDLGEPFNDKGVAEFGLENAVFALGDQFLEIIAPLPTLNIQEVPAGRFLLRNGPGGYMALFQVNDIEGVRNRVDALKIRRVWNIDLAEISATHLHPADVGAAIMSIDEARPKESWRWAGPAWEERSRAGKIIGAVLGTPNPTMLVEKWGKILGVKPEGDQLNLNNEVLIFQKTEKPGLIEFNLAVSNIDAIIDRAHQMKLRVVNHTIYFQGVALHLDKLLSSWSK